MLQTLTKRGLKGFTLIELLVVIAIIGLLSTVIAGPITEARKKGRDAKKIADINSIQTAIEVFSDDNNGAYPLAIDTLVPRYLATLPTNAATTTPFRDKYMYAAYRDSSNRVIGYHLGVKLEAGNPVLGNDRDCSGITGTPPANNISSCAEAGEATTIVNRTWVAGDPGQPTAASAVADFGGGNDTPATVCTAALATCIYDVTD